MNNVLDYGYRFFQSSYDQDEQGTILSVNKDPGKFNLYRLYFADFRFLWILFAKNSRFQNQTILKSKKSLLILFVFCF